MNSIIVLICLLPLVSGYELYNPAKYQCKVVHGGYGEWSCFGQCSVTCGKGVQIRRRHCDSPRAKYGGHNCVGEKTEYKPCDTHVECPINGGWGSWKAGTCSKSCGGGYLTYTRKCNNPLPKHCGAPCDGLTTKTETCNAHQCPIDGDWTKYICEACHIVKAKGCVKKCSRTCTNPTPKYGGKDCVGNAEGLKTCAADQCHDIPPHNKGPCYQCRQNAEKKANELKRPDFVGHACRIDNKHCIGLNGGINKQYPAKHWFFLTCSADGPWCKPCATRTLVYNPKCGQCEVSRISKCTGPMKWRNDNNDEDLDMIDNEEDYWRK